MKKGFETAAIIAGALLVALALSGFAHATSMFGNIPVVGTSSSGNSGPYGQCNTAVAHWDSVAQDCVYSSSYFNQKAANWYSANPYTPANQNPFIKYNSFTDSNGVSYSYNSPVNYADNGNTYMGPGYTFEGSAYPNGNAVYSSPSVPSGTLPSAFATQSQSYGSSYGTGYSNYGSGNIDFGSGNSLDIGNTNSYTNSLNNIEDSYNSNTNNYISGYNGLGSVSPYNAYASTGYANAGYGSSYGSGYCGTCAYSGYYNSWAAYVPTTQPSSYFYYWAN